MKHSQYGGSVEIPGFGPWDALSTGGKVGAVSGVAGAGLAGAAVLAGIVWFVSWLRKRAPSSTAETEEESEARLNKLMGEIVSNHIRMKQNLVDIDEIGKMAKKYMEYGILRLKTLHTISQLLLPSMALACTVWLTPISLRFCS